MPQKLEAAVGLPLKLSQVFGLFPYDSRTMERSFWGLTSLLLMALVSANLYFAVNTTSMLNFDTFVSNLFQFLTVTPWLSSCALLLSSFSIRSEISGVVKRIQLVERRFNLNSRRCAPRSPFLLDFAVRTVGILCEITASYILVRGKTIEQFLIRLVGFYLTHFIQNVYELQFLAFIHLLTSWFSLLSKRLTLKSAITFLESYNDLSVACDELNRAFKVQNFVTVSNNFLLCVVDSYICQTTSSGVITAVTVNTFMRVALRIYQMNVFMISLANLTKQARHFDEVLYTLTITEDTKWLARDVS
ncbi:hypothetical protein GE061_011440 [Apolygus lucorum]|uniref:Gustatory receptor n=1 Tax=Apolygus lucorum TaxID=248454 RepID=A0A8S9XZJ9_APOLU|nr:hypothetical protein GE061_011440 [Apolygus lucorum]